MTNEVFYSLSVPNNAVYVVNNMGVEQGVLFSGVVDYGLILTMPSYLFMSRSTGSN